MEAIAKNKGSVFVVTVFAAAFLSALVSGILHINAQEIQLMQNQIYAIQALAIAEAGLNNAFSELRTDSSWTTGFVNKPFSGGSYTVDVNGTTITSTGISAQGFVARAEADVTLSAVSPYTIRINNLRINE